MKLNFGQNFHESIKAKELLKDGSATFAAIPYLVPATIIGMQNWPALIVSGLGTWVLGAVLKNDRIKGAAIGAVTIHILQSYWGGTLAKWFNRPLWNFTPLTGLADAQSYRLPDGQVVRSYNPTDLPATNAGMNDTMVAQIPSTASSLETQSQPEGMGEIYESSGAMSDNMWENQPGLTTFNML